MTPIIVTLIPSTQDRINSGTDLGTGTEVRFVVFIPDRVGAGYTSYPHSFRYGVRRNGLWFSYPTGVSRSEGFNRFRQIVFLGESQPFATRREINLPHRSTADRS